METFRNVLIKNQAACPAGCSACQEACSKRLAGAAIQAEKVHKLGTYKAATCFQCSTPECIAACAVGAIVKSEADGVIRVKTEECIGCEQCVTACPYGNMYFDSDKQVAVKCDMCDGIPECVAACPQQALTVFDGTKVNKYLIEEDLLTPGAGACGGCTGELALRFVLRTMGRNIVLFTASGCLNSTAQGAGLISGCRVPVFHCCFSLVPSTMAGVYRQFRHTGQDARLVAFVGDGCLADMSFQSMSAAAERGERLIMVCYDNEGYMNTGIQMSSTTPLGAWTTTSPVGEGRHGKNRKSKDVPLLMVAHRIPYVATATVAYPEDLVQKLTKARDVESGMSYIHILAPCPTGWRCPDNLGMDLSRLAVDSNYFPLWEYENGKIRFTHEVKSPRPVKDFVKLQGRFRHLDEAGIQALQKHVDERLARIRSLSTIDNL